MPSSHHGPKSELSKPPATRIANNRLGGTKLKGYLFKMCIPAADFRVGDANPSVLLVGACPGRAEEEQNRPFAGQAGQNLAIMLRHLRVVHQNIFPTARPDDYSMINAHSLPRYKGRPGYDGRTEPNKREVLAQENVDRLNARLRAIRPATVVYLGNTAEFTHVVVVAHRPPVQAFRTGHPSMSAWNTLQIYKGLEQDEKIRRWAEEQFRPVD